MCFCPSPPNFNDALYRLVVFPQEQVLLFLKDIFDLEKVRYSSVETLAEDVLRLLRSRAELLLSYSGSDCNPHANGSVGTIPRPGSGAVPDTRVQ